MAVTKIEWTATRLPDGTVLPGYTFNPWRGCERESPACVNCYAAELAKRNPQHLGDWTPGKPRVMAADTYMRRPVLWNRAAEKSGVRMKVFCASLADIFEDYHGPIVDVKKNPVFLSFTDLRKQVLDIIESTPSLDWLLLTKRPQHVNRMVGEAGRDRLPRNVWIGTTIESQNYATRAIELSQIDATVRFLSCEPLLGPLNLRAIEDRENNVFDALTGSWGIEGRGWTRPEASGAIHWVIAGGESGDKARPSHPGWFHDLKGQCADTGTAFFFKQWGEWMPRTAGHMPRADLDNSLQPRIRLSWDGKNAQTEDCDPSADVWMGRAGKKTTGRLLDGREHNETPEPTVA